MKILYLTPILPYPPDNGGKIKTFRTLELLCQKHNQVHLVCFSASKPPKEALNRLQKICAQVNVIISPYASAQFREMKPFIFKSLFSRLPFASYRYQDKRMEILVSKLLRQERFAAIHIDHLLMAGYLPVRKTCLWVLEEHNLESEIAKKIVTQEDWNKFKLFSFIEWFKLSVFEKIMLSKFDKILAISQSDRQKIEKLGIPEEKIDVLPLAMEPKPSFIFREDRPVIFFVGSLDWWPNKDGLKWFLNEIMPQVKKEVKGIKVVVVGKGADREISRLAKNHRELQCEGYQKSLERYWGQACLFVVPLRAGSGIRIKLLEALSRGVPVVSTTKGAEGVVQKSGSGILLADRPLDFARGIIKLLQDKELAKEMSQSAVSFIKANHQEEQALKALDKIYA